MRTNFFKTIKSSSSLYKLPLTNPAPSLRTSGVENISRRLKTDGKDKPHKTRQAASLGGSTGQEGLGWNKNKEGAEFKRAQQSRQKNCF